MTQDEATEQMGFYHGATWMDGEGRMYIVPGFHEEWLLSNPELAQGAKNVAEMVLKRGWLSIVVFNQGYLEICINDVHDGSVISLLHRYLSKNLGRWNTVLIMPMAEEGYIQVERGDFGNLEAFSALLARQAPRPNV